MHAFEALADPTRRRIVEMLAERELPAGEIAKEFKITAAGISQHLKVLREAGLLTVRVEGQKRIHAVQPAGLREVDQWLERTRRFWSQRLDVLEQELRAEVAAESKQKRKRNHPRKTSS